MNDIYLDHAATTPLHPAVLERMLPYLSGLSGFGNPSSTHRFGMAARMAVSDARDLLAAKLHCDGRQLVFTSGGTESDNLAIFGAIAATGGQKRHIITSQIEHHAVLHACEQLERAGHDVTYIPVDTTGLIRFEELERAIRPDTTLISIMYGNNEVGTLQPIQTIGELARSKGILFHVDAIQALGHIPVDVTKLPVDLMSFSAHKIQGPKGTGALYVSPKAKILPQLFGGSQERKRRAGTENVAGIVGFAAAAELAVDHIGLLQQSCAKLRQSMVGTLEEALGEDGFVMNGHPDAECRLPHIVNVSFPGVDTETLLMNLDLEGIAAASGSACTSGSLEVSHVLRAMQLPERVLTSAVRFSFGINQPEDEIVRAAKQAATIVERIRSKK
ncbi:cysteine desulfurase family protein [Paenibacillus sp. MBLB4367]|uniref:cysteine desulfurase family protein n=1 Tax=Paenibacillus sp. MBLB4367 TaxID=3384767 RepID=UPI003907F36A